MIKLWVIWNVLIIIAALLSEIFHRFVMVRSVAQAARFSVRVDRMLLVLTFASLPLMSLWASDFVEWNRIEMSGEAVAITGESAGHSNGQVSVATPRERPIESKVNTDRLLGLMLFTSLILLFRWLYLFLGLRSMVGRSHLWKKLGRIEVRVSDALRTPIATQAGRSAVVLLPDFLLSDSKRLHLALRHEAQHLRSSDIFWSWMIDIITVLSPLNPALYWWARRTAWRQELSCDETLCSRQRVEIKDYGLCLIWVADQNQGQSNERMPAGAVGMAHRSAHLNLQRRLEFMKTLNQRETKAGMLTTVALTMATSWVGVVWAISPELVPDPISQAELNRVVDKDEASRIPLELTPEVMKWLNFYLRTQRGKRMIDRALERMPRYERMIETAIERYGHPKDLMAVPLVESGFRNAPPEENHVRGAGLWQFIPSTARNYGMVVRDDRDDRMNEEIETDAAMRYLGANFYRFKDWRLSIMAYNVGEGRVQEGIRDFNTRDPWKLYRGGIKGDRYLPKVIAAALILKHPELLEL